MSATSSRSRRCRTAPSCCAGSSTGSPGGTARPASIAASSADNNGPNLAIYRGRIEGDRLVYESLQEALPRIRLTWILKGSDHATWRNEFTLDGQTWGLIEDYEMVAG